VATPPLEPVSTPEFPSPPETVVEMTELEPEPGSQPEPEPEPEREIVLEDMELPPTEPESDNVLVLTPQMRAPLVSATAATASADVLNQLAKAILDRRDLAIGNRDVTLEGMVREMMRPLLKEWLDRNLPYLIERLVKKEIDQMINRAERLED
jgi:cell pole-organizing protein PopZ